MKQKLFKWVAVNPRLFFALLKIVREFVFYTGCFMAIKAMFAPDIHYANFYLTGASNCVLLSFAFDYYRDKAKKEIDGI